MSWLLLSLFMCPFHDLFIPVAAKENVKEHAEQQRGMSELLFAFALSSQ